MISLDRPEPHAVSNKHSGPAALGGPGCPGAHSHAGGPDALGTKLVVLDNFQTKLFGWRVITLQHLVDDLLPADQRACTGAPRSAVEHLIGRALERALASGSREISSDIVAWAVQQTTDLASGKPVLVVLFEGGWLGIDDLVPHSGGGRPPISMAAQHGNNAAVTYLIARGANVNRRSSANLTPLHYATDVVGECTAVISALVAAGGELEAEDGVGQTPLCRAAINQNLEAFTALYQAGADLDKKDAYGARIYDHVGRRSKLAPLLKAIRARKTLRAAGRRRRAQP